MRTSWQGGAVVALGMLLAVLWTTPAAASYADTILNDDPTGYWRLGETSGGVAADASGKGHDCAYTAPGVTYGVPGAVGDGDGAVAVSDPGRVDCGTDVAIQGFDAYTHELWFRTTSEAGQNLMLQRDKTGAHGETYLNVNAGGTLGFFTWDNGYAFVLRGPWVSDGRWHHVAAVRTATGDAYLYVDGVLVDGHTAGAKTFLQPYRVTFGGDQRDEVHPLEGGMDEVAIYSHALSAEQVGRHFAAGTGPGPGAGTPVLVAGRSPGDGAVALAWDRTGVLTGRDADDTEDTTFTSVPGTRWETAPGTPLPEGTWRFRARAAGPGTDPAPSPPSEPVVVDRTGPGAPALRADRPADGTAADGTAWWRDGLVVAAEPAGDPDLPDGSPGSGADAASLPDPWHLAGTAERTLTASASDRAGNESAVTVATFRVDADAPSVTVSCPATVLLGAAASATWRATDAGAGLSGPATGTVALDTSAVGPQTATTPAIADRVGHATAGSCAYTVLYDWQGFAKGSRQAKAGATIAIAFDLAGDHGPGVLAGVPVSRPIDCATGQPLPGAPDGRGAGTATYDPKSREYTFAWATDPGWTGCRELTIALADGTSHAIAYRLK